MSKTISRSSPTSVPRAYEDIQGYCIGEGQGGTSCRTAAKGGPGGECLRRRASSARWYLGWEAIPEEEVVPEVRFELTRHEDIGF